MPERAQEARDRPVRRCVMDPAANLKDLRVGMLHPGITISTTLENYNLFRKLRMLTFDGIANGAPIDAQ